MKLSSLLLPHLTKYSNSAHLNSLARVPPKAEPEANTCPQEAARREHEGGRVRADIWSFIQLAAAKIDLSQPQIFNNNIYGTEYMLGTVLEAEDTAVNKTKIPGLVELTFSWWMGIVWGTGARKKGLSILDGTEQHVSNANSVNDVVDSSQPPQCGYDCPISQRRKQSLWRSSQLHRPTWPEPGRAGIATQGACPGACGRPCPAHCLPD